jgi:hypothetical protein
MEAGKETRTRRIAHDLSVLCGVLSSLLYVATDITGAMRYEGYSYAHQAVSELSAIDAPTRPFMVSLFTVYSLLVTAFAAGIASTPGGKRYLRLTGWTLLGYGALSLIAPLFPMHLRGAGGSLTDTMHVALTGVTVLLILTAIGFGAASFGKSFRIYSICTIAGLVLFGARAFMDGPRIDAGLPTPWFGVIERAGIYAFLVWVMVLAVTLSRRNGKERRSPLGSTAELGLRSTDAGSTTL